MQEGYGFAILYFLVFCKFNDQVSCLIPKILTLRQKGCYEDEATLEEHSEFEDQPGLQSENLSKQTNDQTP